MSYQVRFAGNDLHDYCKILEVKRDILPQRENFSKEVPTMWGSLYTGYHYAERIITLSIAIVSISKEDYMNKVRALADVLDVANPSRLYISDEPRKYYYAVLDGSTDLDRLFNTAKVDINFICHDPLAYSDDWKAFIPDSKGIFTFENGGTTSTYPYIRAQFKTDACFFQCTNPKGDTVLIGQPKDSTLENSSLNTTVLDENCSDSGNFLPLSSSLLTNGRIMDGKLGVGSNGQGLVCTNFGSLTDKKWCGGGLKRSIGDNLEEFEVEIDVIFSSQGENYSDGGTIPPTTPPPSGGGNLGTYKVTTKAGLNVRADSTTSSSVRACMPYGTEVQVIEIKNGWCRHNYKDLNGWSSMQYMAKVSENRASTRSDEADSELGIIEVYGYDQHGTTLFINQIYDGNQYYEFTEPKVFIGTEKVLGQTQGCPPPRKVVVKDDDGKESSYFDVSGVFGEYNDCVGKFVIRRERAGNGTYLWSASFSKYENGNIVKRMETSNGFSSSAFPTGTLNSFGIFIGRYGSEFEPVDVMVVDHIRVKRLNPPSRTETNLEIFGAGDVLDINFQAGTVYKNNIPFLTNIDIGSEFFSIPSGRSQIIVRSDDTSVEVTAGFQERFL
ncbi:distal tail protein Dit [Clostridium perfringens]